MNGRVEVVGVFNGVEAAAFSSGGGGDFVGDAGGRGGRVEEGFLEIGGLLGGGWRSE